MKTLYKKLDKKNYKDYEKDFITLIEPTIEQFISRIAHSGEYKEEEIDFSPESLIKVWRFVYQKLEHKSPPKVSKILNLKLSSVPEYPPDSLPIWFYIEEKSIHNDTCGYTVESLNLMNELFFYYGEVFIKNNKGLKWEACYEPRSRLYCNYKTVIKGLKLPNLYLLNQIFTAGVSTWINDPETKNKLLDTNLFDTYNNILGLEGK